MHTRIMLLTIGAALLLTTCGQMRNSSMAKKRANGEGNIRKRADGRWEGRYTAGYNA